MFTGLIEELGTVVDLTPSGTSLCLKIKADRIFRSGFSSSDSEDANTPNSSKNLQNGLKIGDSIAVNGVCLTATTVEQRMTDHALPYFEVTAVEETLRKTTLSSLTIGTRTNLEPAATIETRLGGHLVQGHVDTTARLSAIRDRDGSWEFDFQIPSEFAKYAVPKGSIAIDGISLTIASVSALEHTSRVTVAIIPHTYSHTNLQFLNEGSMVNVEFDIIAKMVEQFVKPYTPKS